MRRAPFLRVVFSLLILLVVILLTFWPTLGNQFVNFDDSMEIADNPDFRLPVTLEKLQWNWTHTRLTLYMPVTYYVWGAVAAISPRDSHGNLRPVAFHSLNLLLHCICAILVFLLIYQLWQRAGPALLGALVFAVHPLVVEPVAWASGMYTLLSTCFSLMALIAYASHVRQKIRTSNIEVEEKMQTPAGPSSLGRWTFAFYFYLATAFYMLALLTKAASVSLPLAAAAIDLFILGRPIRKMIRSLWLWVVLAIPIIVAAKQFQDVSAIVVPSLWARPLVALDAMGFYCRKIILPIGMIPDYGRNPAWVLQHPPYVLLSAAAAICVLLGGWLSRRKRPWITAGVGIFLAGVGPYLGLTAFDFQYVSTVADRYAYFGLVGLAIVAAGTCLRARSATAALICAVVFWCIQSNSQARIWRDTYTLFDYTREVNHRSLLAHSVFGFTAASEGRMAAAADEYKQALQIWPEDAAVHFNLANVYAKTNQPDLARQHYELAIQYQPNNATYQDGLARFLANEHDFAGAYDHWKRAIAIAPDWIDARTNLADMCLNTGQLEAARQEYRSVLQIDSHNDHALRKLAELAR